MCLCYQRGSGAAAAACVSAWWMRTKLWEESWIRWPAEISFSLNYSMTPMQLPEHTAGPKGCLYSQCWSQSCCTCSWAETPSSASISSDECGSTQSFFGGAALWCGSLNTTFSACRPDTPLLPPVTMDMAGLLPYSSTRTREVRQIPFGQSWCFEKGSGSSRYENCGPSASTPGNPRPFTASDLLCFCGVSGCTSQCQFILWAVLFTGIQISHAPFYSFQTR